jgi:hypothetical protein
MLKQLKYARESPFLKRIRQLIKADPTVENIIRWYQMHARTGYGQNYFAFDTSKQEIIIRFNTFRTWKGITMKPKFIEYKSRFETDAYGTALLKLVDEMDNQITERNKRDLRNGHLLAEM